MKYALLLLSLIILSFLILPTSAISTPHSVEKSHLILPLFRSNPLLANKPINESINIYHDYSSEPAPMGIADYGIGPNGSYIRTTSQVMGIITIYSMKATSNLQSFPTSVSIQLNLAIKYVQDSKTYVLYAQDVAVINTTNNFIYFEDTLGNFTQYLAGISNVEGKGQIYKVPYMYNTYYTLYAYVTNYTYPGSCVYLTYPVTIYFLVNVSLNSQGEPVIYFWYNDGYGWVNFDTVTVLAQNSSSVCAFVNGYNYNAWGFFNDIEFIIGGPGLGATAYFSSLNAEMELLLWNGHNFESVKNAYNFGSDTSETDDNVYETFSRNPITGIPSAFLAVGSSNLGPLWNENNISLLNIQANVPEGKYLVYNSSLTYNKITNYELPFYNKSIQLVLSPGTYGVLIFNTQGQLVGEAKVKIGIGSYSTPVTQFTVSLSPSSLFVTLDRSFQVSLIIQAYGQVSITVTPPQGISYTLPSNTIYVNGQTTLNISMVSTSIGNFTIPITVTLLPGISQTVNLGLHVIPITVGFSITYSVIGNIPTVSPYVILTFPNGTVNNLTLPLNIKIPAYTKYEIPKVIQVGDYRWITLNSTSGIIEGNTNIIIVYYEQVKVTFEYFLPGNYSLFKPPTITFYYLGKENTTQPSSTVWVDYNSEYIYPQELQGSNNLYRAIAYNYEGKITSPATIIVYYNVQFLINVSSPIPIYALINGKNETLTTGWYNYSSKIQIENVPYYISPSEREIISSISPSFNFTVLYPLTVSVKTTIQYFVTVNSNYQIPLYAYVNGVNESISSGWYNESTTIVFENITYYPSSDVRYVILSISPQKVIINSQESVNINVVKQYLVTVSSSYPVTINGIRTNEMWVNSGTSITIDASLPFYLSGSLAGTENIQIGQSVIVNQPLSEKLQTSLSIAFIGLIVGIISAGGAVPVVLMRRRKVVTPQKPVSPSTQPPSAPPSPPSSSPPKPVYSPQMLANWDPSIWVGKELYGYEVKSVIGKGGNGYVLKAELGNTEYAIKVFSMYPSTAGTVTMRAKSSFEQIYTESTNLRRLSENPNIVKIYGIHIDMNVISEILKGNVNAYLNHPPAIVMEFMKGGSVYDLLKNQNLISSPLWPLIVKEIVKEVASALAYIHANGFVHLDVKPPNIFLAIPLKGSPEEVYKTIVGNVKLGDLGSAVRIGSRFDQVTPAYASPEQIEAVLFGGGADPKMDIYSLGMTAYTLLKGKNDNPVINYLTSSVDSFISGDIKKARELINQARNALMNWKPTLPPNTPKELEEIIIKALSVNPNNRPTADEIVAKLS